MANDLFYLACYKNVDKLSGKIEAAKAPEAFTNAYLTDMKRIRKAVKPLGEGWGL